MKFEIFVFKNVTVKNVKKETPLHLTSKFNEIEIAESLLENQVKLNEKTSSGVGKRIIHF